MYHRTDRYTTKKIAIAAILVYVFIEDITIKRKINHASWHTFNNARSAHAMIADDVNRSVLRDIEERLRLGRERYGHGVLVPANADKNWKRELVEELLDAVVYAAADVLSKRGVADDEANDALTALVRERMDADYDFQRSADTQTLDLCIFVARAVTSPEIKTLR